MVSKPSISFNRRVIKTTEFVVFFAANRVLKILHQPFQSKYFFQKKLAILFAFICASKSLSFVMCGDCREAQREDVAEVEDDNGAVGEFERFSAVRLRWRRALLVYSAMPHGLDDTFWVANGVW